MAKPGRQQTDERNWSQWMAAANAGDKDVYQRLLAELGEAMESYIRARFGTLPGLEDCVQECLIAVHNARHTYDPKRAFRPWLFTIVRHKTIDQLRKSSAQGEHSRIGDGFEPTADDGALARIEQLVDGVRILERISPPQRDAIALTRYGGYTTAEAAQLLQCSESALKARLRRGLVAIRKILNAEEIT